MTLAAMEKIGTEEKVQYICTLFRGEALHNFDLVSADAEKYRNPIRCGLYT